MVINYKSALSAIVLFIVSASESPAQQDILLPPIGSHKSYVEYVFGTLNCIRKGDQSTYEACSISGQIPFTPLQGGNLNFFYDENKVLIASYLTLTGIDPIDSGKSSEIFSSANALDMIKYITDEFDKRFFRSSELNALDYKSVDRNLVSEKCLDGSDDAMLFVSKIRSDSEWYYLQQQCGKKSVIIAQSAFTAGDIHIYNIVGAVDRNNAHVYVLYCLEEDRNRCIEKIKEMD